MPHVGRSGTAWLMYNGRMSTAGSKGEEHLPPYGSARDLPRFRELQEGLQAAKVAVSLLENDQGSKIPELEHELERIVNIVDQFYARLGTRNWIFHDCLSLDAIESILNETKDPDESEKRLIGLYHDEEWMEFWMNRISSMAGLDQRRHQIDRAWTHYNRDEFDSCVLHLIAVMDGFVNDFQPSLRKGLQAREPEEMAAWDSVVGHHLGLTHALETFGTTIKKRIDDEVYELYRHGIVHGSVPRFDNVIVATKAWNMLFAVADWAVATTKSKEPEDPEPTLLDLLAHLEEQKLIDEMLNAWQSSSYRAGDGGFEHLEIFRLTEQFMEAWRGHNFGNLVRFSSRQRAAGKEQNQLAGEMRARFDTSELTEFEITDIENCAPVIWVVRGTATVNGRGGLFECRWIFEDGDGNPAVGQRPGEWRLAFCSPSVWRRSG